MSIPGLGNVLDEAPGPDVMKAWPHRSNHFVKRHPGFSPATHRGAEEDIDEEEN